MNILSWFFTNTELNKITNYFSNILHIHAYTFIGNKEKHVQNDNYIIIARTFLKTRTEIFNICFIRTLGNQ